VTYFKQDSIIDKSVIVKNIHDNGWSYAGCLEENIIGEFRDYLDGCDWYNFHVKGAQMAPIDDKLNSPSNCSCVSMDDVIYAPHWFEISLLMNDVVISYFLTDDIVLYSYNAFYSNPSGGDYQGVQNWHVDHDSDNFLTLFVYLTDVNTIEDGAHAFEQKDGQKIDIIGPAGTMFFADTRQKHMGHKPKNQARGMAWARWSLDPNPKTYDIDKLEPVSRHLIGDRYPKDEKIQKIIKKVVN
jgi:hypothetical protein